MKVGGFLACYTGWSLDDALASLASTGATSVELSSFGRVIGFDYSLDDLLGSKPRRQELLQRIEGHGLTISSISCHGNALHPRPAVADAQTTLFRDTVELAGLLGVDTVVDFSGCPGDGPRAQYPNWVTCAWPDDYPAILDWQWAERIVPHWTVMAPFCQERGVRVAIEMHPGMSVYTPRNMMRLRDAVGPTVGANLDPSHLFWQQIDVIGAIRYLGDAIHHVHLKDCEQRSHNSAEVGVLDTTPFSGWSERGWLYRTIGYGHDSAFWREFVVALKEVGYRGVLSVEHEDVFIDVEDGMAKAVALIRDVLPTSDEMNTWWE